LPVRLRSILSLVVIVAAPLRAQSPPAGAAPLAEVVLWPGGAPGALGDAPEDRPAIVPWLPARGTATGAAVLIFPGGGYSHIADAKEGVPAARWLNSIGVAAFIVRYRLGTRYRHEAMEADALRAVRVVRARATEWGIDSARVGVLGFSAGGHMASMAATHFDLGAAASPDPIARASARPTFVVLLYPVITMRPPLAHKGSRTRLLGADSTDAAVERDFSNETRVTVATPPAFIATITNDRVVPVGNALTFYDALTRAQVPVEMHVFEAGLHGFGLAPEDPVLSQWPALCAAWMRRHGWLDARAAH
jgi:acetyl esterase/lipase